MKVKSYFVVVRAAQGHLLLGGTRSHVSSRFETEAMANAWMKQAVETNEQAGRKVVHSCTMASEQSPEITAKEVE